MKILIIGEENRAIELSKTLLPLHEVIVKEAANSIDGFDVVFDMNADERNYTIAYQPVKQLIIASAVKKTLTEISGSMNNYPNIVGMNLLPTLINRELKEVSFLKNEPVKDFIDFAASNSWKFNKVNDAVGMVTPRVLAMIINEAATTLQENTASKEDIDKGMMLGTNFPIGPLAWCDQIGIHHIINVLEALHRSSSDERYKVCNLLLEKDKKKEKFY